MMFEISRPKNSKDAKRQEYLGRYYRALAAAARQSGDVKQAPAESPQSGGEAVTPTPNHHSSR
jgi:hypothetical protein